MTESLGAKRGDWCLGYDRLVEDERDTGGEKRNGKCKSLVLELTIIEEVRGRGCPI
jgi:hypothetical protein